MKIKNISIIGIFAINFVLFLFYFIGCNYFTLMSRQEWEESVGLEKNTYLYLLCSDYTIKAFSIDYDDGSINEISKSPFGVGVGNYPLSFIHDLFNKFVYTVESTPNIEGFSIKNGGELNELESSPNAALDESALIVMDPLSRYLYTAKTSGDSQLTGYSINNTTGQLSLISDSPFGSTCQAGTITIDNCGEYLYASFVSNIIEVYKINQFNGKLNYLEAIGSTFSPNSALIDNSNNYLYVSEGSNLANPIRGFKINSNGTLSENPDSPYALSGGSYGVRIAKNPQYDYVYASASSIDNIYSFKINKDGSLTETFSLGCTNGPYKLSVDPFGRYLYVAANDGIVVSQLIYVYEIKDDGNLSEREGSPYNVGSSYINDLFLIRK